MVRGDAWAVGATLCQGPGCLLLFPKKRAANASCVAGAGAHIHGSDVRAGTCLSAHLVSSEAGPGIR